MEELKRFLDSISYEYKEELKDVKITKVILNKEIEEFDVYINSKKVVKPDIMYDLIKHSKSGINNKVKCNIFISYDEISDNDVIEAFKYVFNLIIDKKPSLVGLKDTKVVLDQDILIIDVFTKIEEKIILEQSKNIIKMMNILGFKELNITTKLNEEKNKEIKKEIDDSHSGVVPVKVENPIFLGKHIDGDIIKINDINNDMVNVIVEAYLFGEMVTLEKDTINIITIKISDKSNSMQAKIFKKDHDEYLEVLSNLKNGCWYRIHGNVKYD
jgi:DNA polymerase III alpha subunit (gram-positive type)